MTRLHELLLWFFLIVASIKSSYYWPNIWHARHFSVSIHPSPQSYKANTAVGGLLSIFYPVQFFSNFEKIFWNRVLGIYTKLSFLIDPVGLCCAWSHLFHWAVLAPSEFSMASSFRYILPRLWQEHLLLFAIGLLLLLFLEKYFSTQVGNPTVDWEAWVDFFSYTQPIFTTQVFCFLFFWFSKVL